MAALSRQAEQLGMDVSANRISTHREHRAEEGYVAVAKRKKDLAVLVRDRVAEVVEDETFDIMDKDNQAAINSGLKAQAILDKRDATQKKHTQADMLVALLGALRGETPMLPSPVAIEGQYVDVTPNAE